MRLKTFLPNKKNGSQSNNNAIAMIFSFGRINLQGLWNITILKLGTILLLINCINILRIESMVFLVEKSSDIRAFYLFIDKPDLGAPVYLIIKSTFISYSHNAEICILWNYNLCKN